MFVLIKVFDFDFPILQAHQVLHLKFCTPFPLPLTTHHPPPPPLGLPIERTPLICNYYSVLYVDEYGVRWRYRGDFPYPKPAALKQFNILD